MKDKVFDLVYNWKHGLSGENKKGTRGYLWCIFLLCALMFFTGIVGIVVSVVVHRGMLAILSVVVLVVGITIFAFMSSR